MPVTFNKRNGLKYTTMAIYIDEHMKDITVSNEHPDIESRIFEYLYHIAYALAQKAMFFKNFEDYDNFSLYVAGELFLSMRKKLIESGQTVRGKEIKPVKSCLNYIKAVLFPLKVNYQCQTFATVFNPDIGQDTSILNANLRQKIQKEQQFQPSLEEHFKNIVEEFPDFIKNRFLQNIPYKNNKLLIKKLYISLILTLLDQITLPNAYKDRVNKNNNHGNDLITNDKFYLKNTDKETPILWHLDKSFEDYVLVLSRELKEVLAKKFKADIHEDDLSENLINDIMNSALATSGDVSLEDSGDN